MAFPSWRRQRATTASASRTGRPRFGVPATIVVPENASAKKVHALEQFDCTLVRHGQSYDEAEQHGLALAAADPALRFVSPYNDPLTMAGQSTISLELLEQVPDLSTVVVPVGGGGLISGVALGFLSEARTDIRVVGVVADTSPAMLRAYEVGREEPVVVEPTLADGLAGNLEQNTITVDIAREHVAAIVGVSEAAIAAGMRYLRVRARNRQRRLRRGRCRRRAERPARAPARGTTAVLVTGRNVAPATLAAVLSG